VRRNAVARAAWDESIRNHKVSSEKQYCKQIVPLLHCVKTSVVAKVLGVSDTYVSDVRRGKRVPHPRHWLALAELAGVKMEAAPL